MASREYRERRMANKRSRKPSGKQVRTQPPRSCKRTQHRTLSTTPSEQEQRPTLDQLPENVLLRVMQHLDVDTLLSCRLVCRRLGVLSLHPGAWRRRTLSTIDVEGENTLTCAVLRLAPCLQHVTVVLPLGQSACRHLHTSTCAVAGLEVKDVAWTSHAAALATRLIQRQATIGRLKRVGVRFRESTVSEADAPVLLGALMSTPGLEELALNVRLSQPFELSSSMCGEFWLERGSSLRRLYMAVKGAEPFAQFLLRMHAATLEEVHFLGLYSLHVRMSISTLQLVAGLPRLRELTLHHDQPGLGFLAKCVSLRTLNIVVVEGEQYSAGAAERLRQTRQRLDVKIRRMGADVAL
ncbi:uncharacterized protein LOC113215188 [Frankliniella occidentalis]|uniref:Uncharacterized protein LOC113215188 n=1 Tax=Frankliniella occidentalis TaxID=133901 RepID=A0A6J1TFR7_FRAOC|nr:uncharacterized protein LOC113215188 [Frankliniella occidentalis]XP_052132945.1 uncharacterized protein LOC113215188 [Frankliniella occidentalis]